MLPRSFEAGGFKTGATTRTRRIHPITKRPLRPLLMGIDGPPDSGKSEFCLSAPDPGQMLCLDRMIDSVYTNPNPPSTRREKWGVKVLQVPLATQAKQADYLQYWQNFYADYKEMLLNPDSFTCVVDGDSDSWELQRLAAFGKLTQIPSIMYTEVNAARRAMIARAWDSGKIVIFTSKVKPEYVDEIDPTTGKVVTGTDGKPKRVKSGEFIRQGFDDQEYLWQVQLRCLYNPEEQQWGVRLTKFKSDPRMVGMELWGDECNFASLVQYLYPEVPLEDWGY